MKQDGHQGVKGLVVMVAAVVSLLGFAGPSAQAASLIARVDVVAQKMTVIHYGKVIHEWPVSTARPGYSTPTGEFRPQRLHEMWHSRSYDMAPMPFAVFYDRGWAIHGTSAVSRLGSPASHGCVRLATADAETFYRLVRKVGAGNTRIIVEN